MIVTEEEYLLHFGTPRKSGRYPWGSGGTQMARNRSFMDSVDHLRGQGLKDKDIANGLGMTLKQLITAKSIAGSELKQDRIRQIERLKAKGMSNVAIGKTMGINESTIRSLSAPGQKEKLAVLQTTSNMLRDQVHEKGYIDIGSGVENQLKISKDKLNTAVAQLEAEGYKKHYVKVPQLTTGENTSLKVLGAPGSSYPKAADVKQIRDSFDKEGHLVTIKPPLSISSRRVSIRYAEDGGKNADGVIYVRPGVPDVSIGNNHYAQVRIAVDGTHYIKGMAVYKDNLPTGSDLVFNTNKSNTGKKHDALKPIKDDEENPFGSTIRQIQGPNGKVVSAMNIVGQKEGSGVEGGWGEWSKTLSSQILSKQNPELAAGQLAVTYERMKNELAEIMALTNPTVKKKLLESFADSADSASVYMKAAALPGQATHVILPVNSMKKTEIYAPKYQNGEKVALIRYPHGGTFEIPELTVNNRNPEARKLLGTGIKMDAVGIHHTVAEHLSGADFDGDTVLVIPNHKGSIKSTPPLDGLKGFDPRDEYKLPKDSPTPRMKKSNEQAEMGKITNLVTDMTIRGAGTDKLARAIRHTMVVIDAEKHGLDYKASYRDNGIAALKAEYQVSHDQPGGGAATLISRAKGKAFVADRKLRLASKGGPIDPATGKKVFEDTGTTYVNKQGKTVKKTIESKKLAETHDAHTLSSGTKIETIYADHSNRLKALANTARKETLSITTVPYSKQARTTYVNEVESLNSKLNIALTNAPLERQAQVIGGVKVAQKRQAEPHMSASELKKVKNQALADARVRVGAKKQKIEITQPEWDAIQAGAISNDKLQKILRNTDLDVVKKLATPKTPLLMTSTKKARAADMLARGYTQAEVAQQLGVSLTTLTTSIA